MEPFEWWPPAVLKSSCIIDVTYFPFDYQKCSLTVQKASSESIELNEVWKCLWNWWKVMSYTTGSGFLSFHPDVLKPAYHCPGHTFIFLQMAQFLWEIFAGGILSVWKQSMGGQILWKCSMGGYELDNKPGSWLLPIRPQRKSKGRVLSNQSDDRHQEKVQVLLDVHPDSLSVAEHSRDWNLHLSCRCERKGQLRMGDTDYIVCVHHIGAQDYSQDFRLCPNFRLVHTVLWKCLWCNPHS